jgi:hypothetical protein
VARGHHQHGVRVLVVPEHCARTASSSSLARTNTEQCRIDLLTEGVVDLEAVALGPGVEGLGGVGRPPGAAADVEVAPVSAGGRRQEHGEQGHGHSDDHPCRHRLELLDRAKSLLLDGCRNSDRFL